MSDAKQLQELVARVVLDEERDPIRRRHRLRVDLYVPAVSVVIVIFVAGQALKAWPYVLLIVLGVVGSVSAVEAGNQGPKRPNLAAMEGKDCRLTTPVFLAADAALSLEVLRSLQKKDQDNIMALAANRKIRGVENGDRARVIDSDWTKDSLKIRVLNGSQRGLEGWVFYGLCVVR